MASSVRAVRGRASATSRSGPAPCATSSRASRLALAFSCGERQLHAVGRDGRGVRRERGLPLEERRHGGRLGEQRAGVPVGEDPVAFVGAQDVDEADRGVGGDDDRPQEADEPFGDGFGGRVVEEVGAVFEDAVDALVPRPLHEVEGEVELGAGRADLLPPRLKSRETRLVTARGQVHDHDLEQRVPGERTRRVEHVHDPLERHVLVVEGGQVGLPHPGEQFAERGVAGGVGAQHQGVEEEPDQVLENLVGAPGDRAAQRDVRTGAQPGQQCRHRRLDDHEHTDVARPGQLAQPRRQFRVQGHVHHATAVAGLQRTLPVHGQRELLGEPVQCPLPERQLAEGEALRVLLVAEQRALPEAVVGVLDRQRRPLGSVARRARLVGDGQVPGERLVGPLVARDVVEQEKQYVLVVPGAEQVRAQRRLPVQLEAVLGGLGEPLGEFLLARDSGRPHLYAGLCRFQDQLVRAPVLLGEDGPQRLVPGDQVVDGQLQRVGVERSGEPPGERDVVRGAGALHPVQHPQALLGEGERHPLRTLGRCEDGQRLRRCRRCLP